MVANVTSERIRINLDDFDFTQHKNPPVEKRVEELLFVDPTGEYLKQPLSLIVEQTEAGNWVAHHSVILTHGYGKSIIDAAQDFRDMLIGLFIELSQSEDELAPHLHDELIFLRSIITDKSLE